MSPRPCNRCITETSILALTIALLAGACAIVQQQPPPSATRSESAAAPQLPPKPAVPSPPPIEPYEKAVLRAATAVLGNAKLPEGTSATRKLPVVIDPLVDGMTGQQSLATRSLGSQLTSLMRERYPQYEVLPFTTDNVTKSPLVLIGTFTGVNAQRQTTGDREAYRICFALADLRSGKLVSKGLAFSTTDGVDTTPLPSFGDAPAWSEDPATDGYIRTCQGTKAGDPINSLYVDRILVAAQVAEAMDAYDRGRYKEALDRYNAALAMPGGDQFRILNGIYLTSSKLGRYPQADAAFAKIVDYGLEHKRLAVKFLFRPGSTAFVPDAKLSGPYPVWLKTIATRTAETGRCLELSGHTSPTGPEPLNERLSQLRAEYIKSRLERNSPALGGRLIAHGMGSRQTMVGNGRDDASDALDRRVEFKVIGC
jgi:outer membrane protein OmpA-like peptidoglycan-associated protein